MTTEPEIPTDENVEHAHKADYRSAIGVEQPEGVRVDEVPDEPVP